jgi:hypothetical protein
MPQNRESPLQNKLFCTSNNVSLGSKNRLFREQNKLFCSKSSFLSGVNRAFLCPQTASTNLYLIMAILHTVPFFPSLVAVFTI